MNRRTLARQNTRPAGHLGLSRRGSFTSPVTITAPERLCYALKGNRRSLQCHASLRQGLCTYARHSTCAGAAPGLTTGSRKDRFSRWCPSLYRPVCLASSVFIAAFVSSALASRKARINSAFSRRISRDLRTPNPPSKRLCVSSIDKPSACVSQD